MALLLYSAVRILSQVTDPLINSNSVNIIVPRKQLLMFNLCAKNMFERTLKYCACMIRLFSQHWGKKILKYEKRKNRIKNKKGEGEGRRGL